MKMVEFIEHFLTDSIPYTEWDRKISEILAADGMHFTEKSHPYAFKLAVIRLINNKKFNIINNLVSETAVKWERVQANILGDQDSSYKHLGHYLFEKLLTAGQESEDNYDVFKAVIQTQKLSLKDIGLLDIFIQHLNKQSNRKGKVEFGQLFIKPVIKSILAGDTRNIKSYVIEHLTSKPGESASLIDLLDLLVMEDIKVLDKTDFQMLNEDLFNGNEASKLPATIDNIFITGMLKRFPKCDVDGDEVNSNQAYLNLCSKLATKFIKNTLLKSIQPYFYHFVYRLPTKAKEELFNNSSFLETVFNNTTYRDQKLFDALIAGIGLKAQAIFDKVTQQHRRTKSGYAVIGWCLLNLESILQNQSNVSVILTCVTELLEQLQLADCGIILSKIIQAIARLPHQDDSVRVLSQLVLGPICQYDYVKSKSESGKIRYRLLADVLQTMADEKLFTQARIGQKFLTTIIEQNNPDYFPVNKAGSIDGLQSLIQLFNQACSIITEQNSNSRIFSLCYPAVIEQLKNKKGVYYPNGVIDFTHPACYISSMGLDAFLAYFLAGKAATNKVVEQVKRILGKSDKENRDYRLSIYKKILLELGQGFLNKPKFSDISLKATHISLQFKAQHDEVQKFHDTLEPYVSGTMEGKSRKFAECYIALIRKYDKNPQAFNTFQTVRAIEEQYALAAEILETSDDEQLKSQATELKELLENIKIETSQLATDYFLLRMGSNPDINANPLVPCCYTEQAILNRLSTLKNNEDFARYQIKIAPVGKPLLFLNPHTCRKPSIMANAGWSRLVEWLQQNSQPEPSMAVDTSNEGICEGKYLFYHLPEDDSEWQLKAENLSERDLLELLCTNAEKVRQAPGNFFLQRNRGMDNIENLGNFSDFDEQETCEKLPEIIQEWILNNLLAGHTMQKSKIAEPKIQITNNSQTLFEVNKKSLAINEEILTEEPSNQEDKPNIVFSDVRDTTLTI